jgi:flagellar hook-associated protein FlgK
VFESKYTELSGTVGNLENQTHEQMKEQETLQGSLQNQQQENEGNNKENLADLKLTL